MVLFMIHFFLLVLIPHFLCVQHLLVEVHKFPVFSFFLKNDSLLSQKKRPESDESSYGTVSFPRSLLSIDWFNFYMSYVG